jgi:hypothetical protein
LLPETHFHLICGHLTIGGGRTASAGRNLRRFSDSFCLLRSDRCLSRRPIPASHNEDKHGSAPYAHPPSLFRKGFSGGRLRERII